MAIRTRQVPSKAPRYLLISKEFIGKWLRSGEGGRRRNSRFAARLATRISARRTSGWGSPEAMADTLILIPARMAATRLPGKPLADIAGLPMIVHVLRRAEAAAV